MPLLDRERERATALRLFGVVRRGGRRSSDDIHYLLSQEHRVGVEKSDREVPIARFFPDNRFAKGNPRFLVSDQDVESVGVDAVQLPAGEPVGILGIPRDDPLGQRELLRLVGHGDPHRWVGAQS